MARRGEVLVAKRRLGFASQGVPERFVVVQSEQLRDLDTILVVPLDEDGTLYDEDPLVVRVSAKESGTKRAHVALVHLLTCAVVERFEAAAAARLSARSMDEIDRMTRFALDL